jgi:peptidoglycan/xylan/chitin deacetylase (PgdA/CDA1 family)
MSARFYLTFHGVGAPGPEVEADERPYWLTPERLDAVLALAAARAPLVGVTFDDGNASDLAIALPLLKRRRLHAHFFIPTSRIGAADSLSADDIRALRREGMQIGSHGMAHVRWPTLTDAALHQEIAQSLEILSDLLKDPVRSVGVPFGAYDSRVLRALRQSGVTRVFTSDGGPARPGAWLAPRNSVRADTSLAALEAMLARPKSAGAYFLRAARRVSRRLIRARLR